MSIMTLTRAGELPDDWTNAVGAAIRRTDPSLKDFHWLWADTWKDVVQRLEELRDSQALGACRLRRTARHLELPGGGKVEGMIPTHRPDSEAFTATWLASRKVPDSYVQRLVHMGQTTEFWVRAGSMDAYEGDWEKGPMPHET